MDRFGGSSCALFLLTRVEMERKETSDFFLYKLKKMGCRVFHHSHTTQVSLPPQGNFSWGKQNKMCDLRFQMKVAIWQIAYLRIIYIIYDYGGQMTDIDTRTVTLVSDDGQAVVLSQDEAKVSRLVRDMLEGDVGE